MDITVTLSVAQEAELVRLTDEMNQSTDDRITPAQFLQREVEGRLNLAASQRAERMRLALRTAYTQATPEEQAAIDAILDKYRGTTDGSIRR